jgi:dolichol-phosphate mannosyltransferase
MLLLVDKVLKKLPHYKTYILVVDDRSPDGTQEIVLKFQKNHKNTILLSGPKRGLGTAMIRGFKFAISKLKADIVISNEADFSYNPTNVPFMLKVLEKGQDAVLGSRKLDNFNTWPLGRRFIHFVANTIFANIVAGVTQVDDHNSAFKAIRVKAVLDKINFNNFPKGFSFFNYLTFKLSQVTPNIYEFKTTFRPRTVGVSKMMIGDGIEYIKTCLQIRFEKIFK